MYVLWAASNWDKENITLKIRLQCALSTTTLASNGKIILIERFEKLDDLFMW